eukprot:scaffold193831_cov18-Prasinocladus_malaysianus.AAC.1
MSELCNKSVHEALVRRLTQTANSSRKSIDSQSILAYYVLQNISKLLVVRKKLNRLMDKWNPYKKGTYKGNGTSANSELKSIASGIFQAMPRM